MADVQSQGDREVLQSPPDDGGASAATKDDAFQSQTGGSHILYRPLPDGYFIRLLELAPGSGDDMISGRLFVTELKHAPEYEAISYVWGSHHTTVPIVCNGHRIHITVNLANALSRVRYLDRPRILWADAICSYSDRSSIKHLRNLRYLIPHLEEPNHDPFRAQKILGTKVK
jgi:hypothetical protein